MSIIPMIGSKDILGVDIGTKVIKVLDLRISKDKFTVLNYDQYDIGAQGVDEKSPEERKQAYIDAIKRIKTSNKFSTKNVTISVSGSSVIVRFVKFPKMEEAELRSTLQFEAEPHIPFDIQDVYMDAQIIGDVEVDSQVKMDAVLVASKKEIIQEKVEIVEKAGFRPVLIDVDAFALENAYEALNKEAVEEVVMLVNIGASLTNISIVEKGISKVVRDLYTAGNSFTRAIQNSMQIPTAQAEELKKKYGLSSVENDNEDKEAAKVYESLFPAVKELNSEIQRSIDYFMGQQVSSEMGISKIVLSGGSAELKGIQEFISSDIRIPVEIFRPLENAEIAGGNSKFDAKSPALAVATGLSIRKIGDNQKK